MRISALAGVVLLLAAASAWAQSTLPTQGAATGGASSTSSSSSSSTNSRIAAAVASGGGSTSSVPPNPLTGATAAVPGVSTATPATANLATSVAGYITTTDNSIMPVFGTELFLGSFAGTRPADRPDYVIQPGDQIAINLYGAINNGINQVVDATGNVFITGVGPVHVLGVRAADLQSTVSTAVRQVFTGAVGVYATVGQAGSIGVFVSGDVNRPGRYIGGAHDSILFFLSQAGGIDAARGSFRNISVRRKNSTVTNYDLYDFLLDGQVQPFNFQDGDVVFVAPRGAMVGVTGRVRNAYAFEAPAGAKTLVGADILPMARVEPTINGVALHGFRNGSPRSAYFTMQDFSRVVLSDGDHIDFLANSFNGIVTIDVVGEIKGPSVYALPRGATLSDLMKQIPLDGTDVDPRFVHIQRPTVAAEQKRAIEDALFNLQKQVLTSAPSTAEAAALATAQATLINQFVERAESVQPDGNIAVYSNGTFQDVRLQDGDMVLLPNKSDVVIVAGEVLNPGGLAHANNLTVQGYVDRAGGFAPHANKKKFVLRHRDGSAEVAERDTRPLPGDEIVVLPTIGSPYLQLAKDISTLLFQIALSTATVVKL